MAAIPTAGGASYAPRWVMRALLRVVVLAGLVAIGWLLGSGTSHADDDLGLPGTGLVPVAHAVSSDDSSSGRVGVHPLMASAITRVLPAVPVPRLGVVRPIVKAVGLPKPRILEPVSRPLHATAPHAVVTRTPAPAEALLNVPPAPPTAAAAVPTAAVRTAAPTPAPAHHPAPPLTLCAPAQAGADSVIVPPGTGYGLPEGPAPVSPPGNSASACLIGSAGGGGGTKGAPGLAAQGSSATTGRTQPTGSPSHDSSDLPRSLSAQPSTSPD